MPSSDMHADKPLDQLLPQQQNTNAPPTLRFAALQMRRSNR
jgi:hypothetical protein